MLNPDDWTSNTAKLGAIALNSQEHEMESKAKSKYIDYLLTFLETKLTNEEINRFNDPTDEFGSVRLKEANIEGKNHE